MNTILSKKAFSIYCDEVARDAVAKNDKLRSENESLQAAQNLLHSVRLYQRGSVLREINLLEGDKQESATHLAFEVEAVELPLVDLKVLHLSISGVPAVSSSSSLWGNRPQITVQDDGTVKMELFFTDSDSLSVIGVLKNISGTIQDLQSMIDGNRVLLYFMNLGMVDARTGQPPLADIPHDGCLDGSTFTLQTIKIAKDTVTFARPPDTDLSIRADELVEDELHDELQRLSKANADHEALCLAADERKALTSCNMKLKLYRDLVYSVEARYPQGRSLRFNLKDGRLQNTVDDEPAWTLQPRREEATIPLSSISRIQINVANMPWSSPDGPLYVARPRFSRDGAMVLKYSAAISAVFLFDESLNEEVASSLADGLLRRYVHHRLFSDDRRGTTTNYQGPEPELTMRLLRLQIRLDAIKEHLDVLGIKMTSEDEWS